MNSYAKVALATAAVVLAALLGYNYLLAPNVGGPRLFAPDPTPSPSPAEPCGHRLHPTYEAREEHLQPVSPASITPRRWRSSSPCPTNVRDIPSAWYKAMYDWGPWHQTNAARLGFGDIANLRVDACDPGPGWQDPPLDQAWLTWSRLDAIPIMDVTQSSATSRRILGRASRHRPGGTSVRLFRCADPVGDHPRRRAPGPGVPTSACECGSSMSRDIASSVWAGTGQ